MKNHRLFVSSVASVLGVAFALGLSGCSANFGDVSTAATQTAMHIRGVVHGGQQPISGSHVYMYAASTTAYGGQGISPTSGNASTSLLTAATGNPADSNGNFYVTTDAFGNFDINGAFACTPNTQVYLYSTGGDPQLAGAGIPGTPNAAASLMAIVGNCASATASSAFPHVTSVFMNEITTQVAAFALAGFATDPLHIGAPSAVTGHSLAGVGLANAFNTALNIVNQATGVPNPTFPNNSSVTVPVERIDTVADFLAACVNSNGPSSSGCSTLFANTNYGTAPTDTAMAAINFAQNPNGNVGALLTLATNASPFQPFFTSANDLSLTLNYTGGGLNFAKGIAIDGTGNAWVTNENSSSVTEISSTGTFLSGANGFTGGGLNGPIGLAIDGAGNAWVASEFNGVTEISSSGAFLSGTSGFTGSGLDSPFAIAIDSPGNVWVVDANSNTVTKLSSSGAALSSYTGGGLDGPIGIAVDGAGSAWVTNDSGNSVTEISSSGAFLSGTTGYFGGGLTAPAEIAIDGTGNAWITNSQATSLSEFSNSGTVLSGTNGYSGGGLNSAVGIAIDGAGNVWAANLLGNTVTKLSGTGTILSGTGFYTGGGLDGPYAIAIDGSGNVWASNLTGKSLTEIIGAAAPVITPIVAGLPAVPTPDGSSNLGTRP